MSNTCTLPTYCLCTLTAYYLHTTCILSAHYARPSALYQIAHLGDDDEEPEFSSAMQLEEGETFFFAPRPLRNLVPVDEIESLSPIMACQVLPLTAVLGCVAHPLPSVSLSNADCRPGQRRHSAAVCGLWAWS